MTNDQIETNEWNDNDSNEGGIRYTCSDSVRITISLESAKLTGSKPFTDYLDSRGDQADYLNNGVLMGWQDFFIEASKRTLKGRDQLVEEVKSATFTQAEKDLVLYGPEEEA